MDPVNRSEISHVYKYIYKYIFKKTKKKKKKTSALARHMCHHMACSFKACYLVFWGREPPLGQSSPKLEKLIPDSSQTSMQSFTPLSFSAAEKSVTVQTNKHSKLSIPTIL